jgi:hypothetical protein
MSDERFAADRFAAEHGPGAMVLSASRMPCLVLPLEQRPRFMPSPLSYALHLRGDVPLPGSDNSRTRRGKRLEPLGEACAVEDHGLTIVDRQVRVEMPELPALTYLDLMTADGVPLELKTVNEDTFERLWTPRPPLAVRVQAQAQAMIANVELVLIGALVIDWYGEFRMELFEEPRHSGMQALLLERSREFMEALVAGELPPPDESESSYAAWAATARFAKGETVLLAEPEAVERARRWRQARADLKAAQAVDEASRMWFSCHSPQDAERIELLDGTVVKRTVSERRGYTVAPGRSVTWRLEEDK